VTENIKRSWLAICQTLLSIVARQMLSQIQAPEKFILDSSLAQLSVIAPGIIATTFVL